MRSWKPSVRLSAVVFLVLSSVCLSAEPAALDGQWEAIGAENRGAKLDAINFEGMRWTIEKDSLVIAAGRSTPAGLTAKPPLQCTFVLNDKQSPAHFDWTIGAGEKKTTIDAIYELKNDVLRVCFARRGQPRPTSFVTLGQEWSVYEFKRTAKE